MPRQSSATNAAERAATNLRRVAGENIKAHRIARDLSQEELAEKFGVSRAAVSQYEIGVGEVNAGDLPRLAGILGISLAQFSQPPPEPYIAPKGPDFPWMLEQIERARGGARSYLPQRSLVGDARYLDLAPDAEEAALDSVRTLLDRDRMSFNANGAFLGESASSGLVAQFSLLTEDSQNLVRQLVRALLEAPSARRRTGAKRVKRRLKARENRC